MKNFLTGLALGSIAGLLLAPKAGKHTRSDLRARAQKGVRAASDFIARRPVPSKRHRKPSDSVSPPPSSAPGGHAVAALNTLTREALMTVEGIGPVLADRIIENRPYRKVYEILERGILPESTFDRFRRELLDKSA